MANVTIKQGDAYALPVTVKLNGTYIPAADIELAEFMLGEDIRITAAPSEGGYSESTGTFFLPLTQEETFGLTGDEAVEFDVRIKFSGGNVIGAKQKVYITIADAISEVEL